MDVLRTGRLDVETVNNQDQVAASQQKPARRLEQAVNDFPRVKAVPIFFTKAVAMRCIYVTVD